MEAKKMRTALSQLEQLKAHTVVVADTGDIDSIKLYKPTDATTNPSLILLGAQNEKYAHFLTDAAEFAKKNLAKYNIEDFLPAAEEKIYGNGLKIKDDNALLNLALDKVAVNFGTEILKIVDGVVSTEVDARLSFDTEQSVARARRIIKLYEQAGVSRERVLIKLASTWEGFEAAKILKQENIKCNMTLLFSFSQAVVAAEAGVELISPFVGRILDWFKANSSPGEVESFKNPANDPGCKSVAKIYNYYKKHGYKTIVMGASFRSKGEIVELVGCDKLTIGPNYLKELGECDDQLELKLSTDLAMRDETIEDKIILCEKDFRFQLNEDAMATEKLAEGIRKFAIDIRKLEAIMKKLL